MRRTLSLSLMSVLFLTAQTRPVTEAEAMKIHRSLLLIDTHNDVTSETVQGLDLSHPNKPTHTNITRLKEGNVGATFFAVYVAATYARQQQSAHRALEMIDTVKRDIAGKFTGDFQLAMSVADIENARKAGKIAALMGIEGGHAIEDSLRLLRTFYDLGVRYMTLTHSNNNSWADSSGSPPEHNGLTPFGKEVVREMNRLGMMVDISHVSDKTFWDVLATSSAPPFASHSSCRAISNIARNMDDDMIRALGRKGGVVQINFGCEFLNQKAADASPLGRLPAASRPKAKVRASLNDVVAHIDHVVKVAGIDHAGIGSDFDGVGCVPQGLEDVSEFPNLTRALLQKGYSAADIGKIYSGNLLRVMKAVELAASR